MEISVVTAVYNGEEYLEESIESILKQTFPQFEYIIVNDCSDDKTKEILEKITDPRVKVIHLEKKGGAANALNIAISHAKGTWIALQDADDVSVPHRLEKQLQFMKTNPGVVAVGSLIQCIPGKDMIDEDTLRWEESFFNKKEHFRNEHFLSTPLCHGTGFYSKSAFESIGGYDPSFKIAYDYDLWTRMFEMGEISRVPEVLYQYRMHGSSLAHSNTINTTNEILISTFKRIPELRFKHVKKKPKLLLIGTKKHYEFYKSQLEHRNHYLELSFFDLDQNNIKDTYTLFRSKEIDGMILAFGMQVDGFLRFFKNSDLSFGKNLFVVWIPDNW